VRDDGKCPAAGDFALKRAGQDIFRNGCSPPWESMFFIAYYVF